MGGNSRIYGKSLKKYSLQIMSCIWNDSEREPIHHVLLVNKSYKQIIKSSSPDWHEKQKGENDKS